MGRDKPKPKALFLNTVLRDPAHVDRGESLAVWWSEEKQLCRVCLSERGKRSRLSLPPSQQGSPWEREKSLEQELSHSGALN